MKVLPVVCVAGAVSCATQAGGVSPSKLAAAARPSASADENKLGLKLKDELERRRHVRYIEDPEVASYVNAVADRVLRQARADRPELAWHVLVIDEPKVVNAFATPGGFVYVTSGLLLATTDEAELAAVLGHEAGHVTARHVARHPLGSGAHSRVEEDEADELGARYTTMAGYDPQAMVDLLELLRDKQARSATEVTFLTAHPPTPERMAHLERLLAEHPFSGVGASTGQFEHVRRRVEVAAAAARFGM